MPTGTQSCNLPPDETEARSVDLRTLGKADALEDSAAEAEAAAVLLYPRRDELKLMASAADRATLEGMIAGREKELAELPEPVNTQAAEAEIGNLQDGIGKLEIQLADIARYEGAREATEKQAAERDRLTEEIEVLETLVELTGSKGIPGRLLSETIGPLEKLANERLATLTAGRYQLSFQMEPDFHIIVTHDGAESDLKLLSSSERMRLGIILQDAISRLSGVRTLLIDNADMLDPTNRLLLTETLLRIVDDYDSILVMSTVGPGGVSDPAIEGLAVYEIRDGEIRRVVREAVAV